LHKLIEQVYIKQIFLQHVFAEVGILMTSTLKRYSKPTWEKVQEHYDRLLANQKLVENLAREGHQFPSSHVTSASVEEARRLANSARSVVTFFNEARFYEAGEERSRTPLNTSPASLPEAVLEAGEDPRLSVARALEAMRQDYVELLALQRENTYPYAKKPLPFLIRLLQNHVVRYALAALVIVVLAYFGINGAVNAALNQAYTNGTTAIAAQQWNDAVDAFTFVHTHFWQRLFKRTYRDTPQQLIVSYRGTIERNINQKQWDDARNNIRRYQELELDTNLSRFWLARSYVEPAKDAFSAGKSVDTRNLLDQLPSPPASTAQPLPSDLAALYQEAERLYRDTYFKEAQAASENSNPNWETVNQTLTTMLQHGDSNLPFNPDALNLLVESDIHLAQQALADDKDDGRWEKARTILSAVQNPPLSTTSNAAQALNLYRDTYYKPGQSLLKAEQYEEARTLFKQLLDFNQGRSAYLDTDVLYRETYYRPASALLEKGRYEDARALFKTLKEMDATPYRDSAQQYWETFYQPAKAQFEAGDYAKAREAFAILNNADGQVYRDSDQYLRRSYFDPAQKAVEQQDWATALKLLETLYKIDSNFGNTQTLLTRTYYKLGEAAIQANDLTKAQFYLEDLRSLNPEFQGLRSLLSAVYYQQATSTALSEKTSIAAWEAARPFLLRLYKFNPSYRDSVSLLRDSYYFPARQAVLSAEERLKKADTTQTEQADRDCQKARDILTKLLNGINSGSFQLSVQGLEKEQTFTGQLISPQDIFRQSLLGKRGARITASVTDLSPVIGLDAVISLYDSNNRLLMQNDDANGGFEPQISDFELSADGRYSIVVTRAQTLAVTAEHRDAQTLYHESYYCQIRAAIQGNKLDKARDLINTLDQPQLSPFYRDIRSLYNQTYYDPAVAAMNAKQWSEARIILRDLLKLEPFYRDAFTLLRESYYRPAQEAFDRGEWPVVREALIPLIYGDSTTGPIDPAYRGAQQLFIDSYYIPGSEAVKQKDWTTAHNGLGTLIFGTESLPPLSPNYKDVQTLLRESYYQPAKLSFDAKRWADAQTQAFNLLSLVSRLENVPIGLVHYGPRDADAQILLREAYYRPAVEALRAKQWNAVQVNLNNLLRLINQLDGKPLNEANYGKAPNDARTLLHESYLQPAQIALDTGDWQQVQIQVDTLLRLIASEEGISLKDANYGDASHDARTLLGESYLRPARAAIDNQDWKTAHDKIIEGLTKISQMDGVPFEKANFGPKDGDAQMLLREIYFLPAEQALKTQDWGVARTNLAALVALDPTYKDARRLFLSAYLQPAQIALQAQDWAVAQSNFSQALALDAKNSEAAAGLRDAYLLPARAAFEAQDWATARFYATSLIRVLPGDADASDLLKQSFIRPIEIATQNGDSAVARRALVIFASAFSQDVDTYRRLLLNTYSIPLHEAVDRQDWYTAAKQFLSLRGQNLSDSSIDLLLEDYAPLRGAVAATFAPYWSGVSFANGFRPFKGTDAPVNIVSLSASGGNLVGGTSDGTIWLWNITTQQPVFAIRTQSAWISTLVTDNRSGWISSAGDTSDIHVWDLQTGQTISVLSGHTGRVTSLSSSNGLLASGSEDSTIRIWSAKDWTLKQAWNASGPVSAVQFSPDGQVLASAVDGGRILLWNIADGKQIGETTSGPFIRDIVFAPDGGSFVSIGNDSLVRIWTREGKLKNTIKGHTGWVRAAAFSSDGRFLASAGADRQVYIWDASSGILLNRASLPEPSTSLQFSSDGSRLIASGGSGTLYLWTAQ
jgi:hypothetical protein